jgi:hypothetical protein
MLQNLMSGSNAVCSNSRFFRVQHRLDSVDRRRGWSYSLHHANTDKPLNPLNRRSITTEDFEPDQETLSFIVTNKHARRFLDGLNSQPPTCAGS